MKIELAKTTPAQLFTITDAITQCYPIFLRYRNTLTGDAWELGVQSLPELRIVFKGERLPAREEMESCLFEVTHEQLLVDMFMVLAEIGFQERRTQ